MNETVSVTCRPDGHGWTCEARVTTTGSETKHEVSVSNAEMDRYGATARDPEALVEAAFKFLLEREPKESILRRFAIGDIESYFPEFGRKFGR